MRLRFVVSLVFLFSLVSFCAAKDEPATSVMTEQHKVEIIRTFNSELVYIRTRFPMGKTGLTIKDGKLSPSGEQLEKLVALWGPAVKPGDRALITKFEIKGDRMRFEINGGPVRKQKWYQHISVGVNNTMTTPGDNQSGPFNNPRGSYVDLMFDHHIPDLTVEQLKQLLWPVFDFDSKSPVDAYVETVPPKVKQAIKSHQVLVGMNREMVIYSKGRPDKKIREKDDKGAEYEDWIYGDPPKDVDFVRIVGDEVIRVETMKVNGEKIVKTEKEIDLGGPKVAVAAQNEQKQQTKAPSLRRPGEEPVQPRTLGGPTPIPNTTGGGPNTSPSDGPSQPQQPDPSQPH
jgi:hypothetical protein